MYEQLNEPIDVLASFSPHRTVPKTFFWKKQKYNIEKLHLTHAVREGTKRIFYFSVSDVANQFKLRLDTEHLEWRLVELHHRKK